MLTPNILIGDIGESLVTGINTLAINGLSSIYSFALAANMINAGRYYHDYQQRSHLAKWNLDLSLRDNFTAAIQSCLAPLLLLGCQSISDDLVMKQMMFVMSQYAMTISRISYVQQKSMLSATSLVALYFMIKDISVMLALSGNSYCTVGSTLFYFSEIIFPLIQNEPPIYNTPSSVIVPAVVFAGLSMFSNPEANLYMLMVFIAPLASKLSEIVSDHIETTTMKSSTTKPTL